MHKGGKLQIYFGEREFLNKFFKMEIGHKKEFSYQQIFIIIFQFIKILFFKKFYFTLDMSFSCI